jgi:hypothetical protein
MSKTMEEHFCWDGEDPHHIEPSKKQIEQMIIDDYKERKAFTFIVCSSVIIFVALVTIAFATIVVYGMNALINFIK